MKRLRLWVARHIAPIKISTHDIPISIPAPEIARIRVKGYK